jgi:hypothetical protein
MTKKDGGQPDRGTNGDSSHIGGAVTASHNRINEPHCGLGDLREDHRDSQSEQLARFCKVLLH